jgi:hypothetical protein
MSFTKVRATVIFTVEHEGEHYEWENKTDEEKRLAILMNALEDIDEGEYKQFITSCSDRHLED